MAYVYVHPFGTSDFLMKKQVSVPLCSQILWNNRPSSLAKLCPNVLIFGDLDELAILKCVACIFADDGANETS
jgi:hypothetical protein